MDSTKDTLNGTLIIDGYNYKSYVIWDNDPCRPESFPLIFKHPIKKTIHIPIQKNSDTIILSTNMFRINDILWPGIETLTINPIHSSSSCSDIKYKISVSTDSIIDSPIEISTQDSKQISITPDSSDQVTMVNDVSLIWDPICSVLRVPETRKIIGIPKQTVWKTLCNMKSSKIIMADIKWNTLLKKYQVITIKKDGKS